VTLGIVEDITRVHALATDDSWLQQSHTSASQTAMLSTYVCVVMHICIGGSMYLEDSYWMALSFNSKLESSDPLNITRWIEGRGNISFMENDVKIEHKYDK